MARSSGGGSRSGGSHSGGSSRSSSRSSGSSSSSRRVSDNPFHGCRTFRYTRNGVHHYVYSNTDLRNIPDAKPRWFLIFFYIPFAFSIIAMLFSGFHPIEKPLNTLDYENVLVIDEAEIFIQSEETALLGTLRKFSETTGITTQIVTVPRERWMNYISFEDYAYDRYYEQFDNENSWLLLYSEYDNGYQIDWNWEGIQGDNTFGTMDVFLYDFNNTLHLSLSDGSDYDYPDVSQSFTKALNQSVQLFSNQEASFTWEILPGAVLMTLFVCFHSYIMIFAGTKKNYSNKELEEVYSESTPKKDVAIDIYRKNVETITSQIIICPYCGIESSKEQDGRCPNCGATL